MRMSVCCSGPFAWAMRYSKSCNALPLKYILVRALMPVQGNYLYSCIQLLVEAKRKELKFKARQRNAEGQGGKKDS